MFGLIIRGVFLVGIVGWYSTSLWKMIDEYWKDQFKRYLDHEYQKNPHMRGDVLMHADKQAEPDEKVTGQSEIPVTDSSCSGPECAEAAGAADPVSMHPREENAPSSPPGTDASNAGVEEAKPRGEGETGKKKKEVARPVVVDPPAAFQADRGRDTENRPGKIRMMQDERDDSRDSPTSEEPRRQKQQQKHRSPQPKKEKKSPVRRTRRKTSKKPQIGVKTEEESKRKGKRRIAPIIFTTEDFEAYQREHPDREFEEFGEEEEDRDQDGEGGGIWVEDLPFKPAVDIYDLARLSEDEYCPLTLDDDPSCEETRPWSY